jgi:Protein of unknown function (DUF1566)
MSKHARCRIIPRLPGGGSLLSGGVSARHAFRMSLLWGLALSLLFLRGALADSTPVGVRWKNLGSGVLKDRSTGLEWTKADNGNDIDWNDAREYCDGRRKGWRLPILQELKTIFDQAELGARCAQAQCKVSSQFNLTGTWFWSATQVGADSSDGGELAWGVLMVNGAQTQAVREASYGSRALCVRSF